MNDFRKRLARAFAEAEIKAGRRIRRAEVNSEVLKYIKSYISDKFHPRMNPMPGDPVGRLWGVDVYVNESLSSKQVVTEA
jgi:hypothetical protein